MTGNLWFTLERNDAGGWEVVVENTIHGRETSMASTCEVALWKGLLDLQVQVESVRQIRAEAERHLRNDYGQ